MNRRHCGAAAIALVCALGVLSLPAQALAAPVPPPSASPSPSAGAEGPTSASAKTLERVREEIDRLYRKAGSAADAYNLAEEKVEKQTAEVARLNRAVAEGRAKIIELNGQAGAQAREQYRTGGLPFGAQLMLSDDPRLFLDGINSVRQSQQATTSVLSELSRAQVDLETYTRDADLHREELEANRVKQAKAKKKIDGQIAEAKKLESELAKEERARLLKLEQDAQKAAQAAWLGSGALADVDADASKAGRTAVAFATGQLGKPYVWGAEGPDTYDCSGLTSQAWAAAKHPIPRTSQEQWRQLPHIGIGDMRPGDLIIYHDDASHVGMYVGDGKIVHAPRPGRNVTVAGAGSMEILGVVRPDAS
ncbi:C40 family peptidase [uncultured Streptomyces sp.]|uniref:C40 family peptidase n=1 Tax=uncultured Streptomyces sp. TaxID=174707 RepID=UPI00261AB4C5|nr:C40 family peptidase [uncultured Streptomyces sp.]